jgi:hypothetical protein
MRLKDANLLTNEELAVVLDFADTVGGWIKSVRNEAFKRASQKTGSIPGYKLTEGRASYEFKTPEEVPQAVSALGLQGGDIYEQVLLSPAKLKAKLKAKYKGKGHDTVWKAFDDLIHNVGGASTSLVRHEDARDEVKRGHEFKALAEKTVKHDDLEDLL